MKKGAYDFLTKPIEYDALEVLLRQALNMASMQTELDLMRRQAQRAPAPTLLGDSHQMRSLLRTLDKVAQSPATTVLITGETGTGKELAARTIHSNSARGRKPFVVVNCTVLHEQLLESELFGHERGAFTDAKESKRGLLEIGNGGTILLDEIGDMDFKLQSKILRVLETGIFRRLGGTQEIEVDVRMIAATNKNLVEEIKKGTFRQDLYYRLQVVPVHMPPLREHKEDLLPLAEHFLAYYALETRKAAPRLAPGVEAALVAYDWPGNVRELRNLMEHLMILGGRDTIAITDLPEVFRTKGDAGAEKTSVASVAPGSAMTFKEVKQQAVMAFEKNYLESLMRRHEGNISKCAKDAKIERRNFQRLLKKYNISAEAFRV
jgi:DNA-binding NtrC family response regulator